jgi:hypothetical protein
MIVAASPPDAGGSILSKVSDDPRTRDFGAHTLANRREVVAAILKDILRSETIP